MVKLIDFWFKMFVIYGDIKIRQQAIVDTVNPAMNRDILSSGPSILNDIGATDIADLLDDVEFTQTIEPVLFIELIEFRAMKTVDISDVPQPVIDEPEPLVTHRGFHTTTAIVTDNHDVFNI